MTAFEKLRGLIVGADHVEGTGAATLPVPTITDAEEAAIQAVQRFEAQCADLTVRRQNLILAVDGLTAERSKLARLLATGNADAESRFAEIEGALPTAQARLAGLDELLTEAEASRKEAQLAFNEAERPRREAERRERIAELRAAAEAAAGRFCGLYAEAASTLATLADRLDALSFLDAGAASAVGSSLSSVEGDPLRRLEAAGWTARQRSPYVACEFRLFAVMPPAGG